MRKLVVLLAVAGLAGCADDEPHGGADGVANAWAALGRADAPPAVSFAGCRVACEPGVRGETVDTDHVFVSADATGAEIAHQLGHAYLLRLAADPMYAARGIERTADLEHAWPIWAPGGAVERAAAALR